ncbi:BspA family leucine-rich repeat surface protein [Xylocopilactobacillus apis]|uniref:Surface protein n=1 Tax=Xylocopilactobacillus apis TaxID=2932183 RepID=A0AAU9DPB7_9LACO|nr:BspA family leucine-rich repeat surface protein [Xylocopilactobacillus apis]BDR56858.1 hypothetical protein KIMC2_14200 [Xylocopilactobacillus apis]
MKLVKKLGYVLAGLSSILILAFVLNFKQDSKAADFPTNIAVENNGSVSRGGRLVNNVGSSFVDPFQKDSPPKFQPRIEINPRIPYELVQNRDFRLTGESQFTGGQSSVHLVWSAVANLLDGYVIERSENVSAPVWDTPPVNYGKHVNILNVYPDGGNFLKQWMDQIDPNTGQPVSMGLISVDAVSLTEFNKNASYYLKKGTSSYQYDGVYFGSKDVNGGDTPGVNDLTAASQPVVADFGASGRSVIFGHDTIFSHGWHHPYFGMFASKLDLFLNDNLPAGYHIGSPTANLEFTDIGSPNVVFTKDGYLNRYPYNLDPTKTYLIKPAHTVGQFYSSKSNATKWMEFGPPLTAIGNGGPTFAATALYDPSGTAVGSNNWYLITKDNYAQIQTGHTTGSCSPDEAKIIANMIYYTSTLTMNSPGDDHTVKDKAAPNIPTTTITQPSNDQINITVNSQDNKTDYYYRIKARTSTTTKYSDVIKVPVMSGFRGYIYAVDNNPNGVPKATIDPSTGLVSNINLNPTSGSSQASFSLTRLASAGKYLHIVAVDNANNVSAAKTINLSDYLWWKYETGTLTIYPHVLNADVDSTIGIGVDGMTHIWPWNQYKPQITKTVISPGVVGGRSLTNIFDGCTAMTSIEGLTNLNTTNVEDYNSMFNYCKSLTSLDFSNFNTVKSIVMFRFMRHCENITSLTYGPNFITNNVQNFGGFYEGMHKMTTFDLSHINTSSAVAMTGMFGDCPNLKTLDVSHFDTSKVSDMRYMFEFDSNLEELDLSSFSGASLTSMYYMFKDDFKLKRLKFSSSFNTSKVTTMEHAFENCRELRSLDLSTFVTNPNTTNMDNLLYGTSKLWQLKLGTSTKLSSTTGLGDPTPGTEIADLDNPTPVYYATNPQWREALTPATVHAPTGAARTAAQIATESQTRNTVRTYVWDQNGSQKFAATPGNINFGTHAGYLKNKEYISPAQNINVTDNRNVRTGKRWHVEVAVTNPFKLATDSTKVIRGNPLYYHNTTTGAVTHLLPTAQTLHSEIATSTYQDVKNYPWTLSFKASPSDIPKAGTYNATVTFTLVNDTP